MTFAEFVVDARAGSLTRHGERVKLQDLPFRLLVLLLERPGSVVTRDELRRALWGDETFVDAEAGLNTAIAKIREALGDQADTPRFIETVPKRGYRFIGALAPPPMENAGPTAPPAWSRPVRRSRRSALVVAALLVLAAALWIASAADPRMTLAVVRFHNETGRADHDVLAGRLTDAVVVGLAADRRYAVIGNSPLLRTERIFADARAIGTALDAAFVILGQLQQDETGLIVRAHLIRVSDETHVWADTIRLPDVDVEAHVVGVVTRGIAGAMPAR